MSEPRTAAATLLADLVPVSVAAVEAFDDTGAANLFAEEEEIISHAAQKRRREFTTVRGCARAAMARLGIDPVPILPDAWGAPRWPDGVVGSMTHCNGYRASALAWRRDVVTLGVDAEPNAPLPDGVLDVIAAPAEQLMLRELSETIGGICWDRMLFSAKEAIYKAWYPLTTSWLGFSEVSVHFDPMGGTFIGQLLVPGPRTPNGVLRNFPGRWVARAGLVVTAIAVPARPVA